MILLLYVIAVNVFHSRLYFVSQENRQESTRCASWVTRPSERAFSLVSSALCVMVVFAFFISTWMFGFNYGGSFGKACLHPDDIFPLRTFETFGTIWVFGGIIVGVNLLGILFSASLYFWLKFQDKSTLITTKVIFY